MRKNLFHFPLCRYHIYVSAWAANCCELEMLSALWPAPLGLILPLFNFAHFNNVAFRYKLGSPTATSGANKVGFLRPKKSNEF